MIDSIPELEDLGSVDGKNVLVRVDFNVPVVDGVITDDLRITAALPTIEYLESNGANVTLCSHFGRPGGVYDASQTLDPVRERLVDLNVKAKLLQNLRFNPGEKANSKEFVEELVAGQDFFVNDAFGVAHRSDASVVGPPMHLKSAVGRLFAVELNQLGEVLNDAPKPFVAILGGLKISDKLQVVESLLPKVDSLLVGGAMAFTFLKAKGHNVGASLVEESMIEKCGQLLESSEKIMLPTDTVALEAGGELGSTTCLAEVEIFGSEIHDGWLGADIGPETAAAYCEVVATAGSVFWNGPMGAFEDARFSAGTSVAADSLAESDAFTVIGGGDSAAAAAQLGIVEEVDHVSTGGGASLAYLETGDLEALVALRESHKRFG